MYAPLRRQPARRLQASSAIVFGLVAVSAGLCGTHPVRIHVSDDVGDPLPCRIHLKNAEGAPQKVSEFPSWDDHFVFPGRVTVNLEAGRYVCEIERGPEYERVSTVVNVTSQGQNIDVRLSRISKLRDSGWYSGDLHVHRKVDDIELLMDAEDLDFAPVITWWNNQNAWRKTKLPSQTVRTTRSQRIFTVMAGEDEREGGALLYFGLNAPLDLKVKSREYPSPMHFVNLARDRDPSVWIDIEKPFWWDVPIWLASGRMNSIGIANNHMSRSQMYESEAWGRARDAERLPAPRGNGIWTQEIYYHILNSGIRIPPSAGSASGVLPNPVGYNRVYVHLDGPFSSDAWFKRLAKGHCFVTNGPLLSVKANGKLPGETFEIDVEGQLDIDLDIQLASNDRVSKLEFIHNGRVVKTIPCSKDIRQEKPLSLTMKEPGWFLVRAMTDVAHTFRFASTAPWYVDRPGAKPRISQRSAQFFLDWTDERIARVQKNVSELEQLRAVLEPHQMARTF